MSVRETTEKGEKTRQITVVSKPRRILEVTATALPTCPKIRQITEGKLSSCALQCCCQHQKVKKRNRYVRWSHLSAEKKLRQVTGTDRAKKQLKKSSWACSGV